MRIAAIVCVRDGADSAEVAIRAMLAQDVAVAAIDHGSTDATAAILDRLPLLARRRLAWQGHFSLGAQLAAKQTLIERLAPDWVIHFDADELLHPLAAGRTLRQMIETADRAGASAIDFRDCTFVPPDDTDHAGGDYVRTLRHYYLFEPYRPRMMRAFKAGLSNLANAGHVVEGAVLFPEDGILRHYIALSRARFLIKYRGRRYDPAELAQGWHVRREAIKTAPIRFPDALQLKHLPPDDSFDLSEPWRVNFWDQTAGSSS